MKANLALAAFAAAIAIAAPAASAQMMGPGTGMMNGGFFSNGFARAPGILGSPSNMGDIAAAWLAGLHDQLQVTPAQEAAWKAFANAVTAQAAAMQSFRTLMAQSAAATAPERADLMEKFMAQRLVAVGDVNDALSVLYAQLTPAQRAVLDQGYALQCGPWGLFGD